MPPTETRQHHCLQSKKTSFSTTLAFVIIQMTKNPDARQIILFSVPCSSFHSSRMNLQQPLFLLSFNNPFPTRPRQNEASRLAEASPDTTLTIAQRANSEKKNLNLHCGDKIYKKKRLWVHVMGETTVMYSTCCQIPFQPSRSLKCVMLWITLTKEQLFLFLRHTVHFTV